MLVAVSNQASTQRLEYICSKFFKHKLIYFVGLYHHKALPNIFLGNNENTYKDLFETRYVPRNMGMPPPCKVCMSYIFHAYTINKSNVSTNTFQIKLNSLCLSSNQSLTTFKHW